MVIQVKSCIDGARRAKGTAVIIDVIRACSTIVTSLAEGAKFVYPFETVEEGLKVKEENPDWILASDQRVMKELGHFDNSPTTLSKLDLKGKKIILITENGTRGIVNAKKADEILVGSFLNTKSIVNYLRKKDNLITLVPMGDNVKGSERKSIEDECCAEYIRAKLLNKKIDFSRMKEKIMKSENARHLIETNREKDVDFCLRLDYYDIVPKLFSDGKVRKVNV